MADKRAPGHSLDEWMKLVVECRQSGLTDAAWGEGFDLYKANGKRGRNCYVI